MHRVTGTLLGVGVGVGLLLVGVELLVAAQYVLAVAFTTPLSLVLVHVGVPGRSGAELIGTRLADTVVGTAAERATAALVAGTGDEPALRRTLEGLHEVGTAAGGAAPGGRDGGVAAPDPLERRRRVGAARRPRPG